MWRDVFSTNCCNAKHLKFVMCTFFPPHIGSFHVHQDAYGLLPGDSFRTTCYYRDGDKFGLSSQEEMCIVYIIYYPAKQLMGYPWICPPYNPEDQEWSDNTGCAGELKHTNLNDVGDLGRNFGSSPSECTAEPTSNSPPTGAATLASSTTSSASWHAVSFLLTLPTVSVLLLVICM